MNQLEITNLARRVRVTASALRLAPLEGPDLDLVFRAALTLDDVHRVLLEHATAHERDDRQLDLDDVLEPSDRTADLEDPR